MTHNVIGADMDMHRPIGCRFLKAVNREALALEFAACDSRFRREVELPVFLGPPSLQYRRWVLSKSV